MTRAIAGRMRLVNHVVVVIVIAQLPAIGPASAHEGVGDCGGPCSSDALGGIQSDCVAPAKPKDVQALREDGVVLPALAGDGLGRIYSFDIGGSTIPEVIPPATWNPLEALDDELRIFGYPPRPRPPLDLNPWKQWMSRAGATRRVASDLCI